MRLKYELKSITTDKGIKKLHAWTLDHITPQAIKFVDKFLSNDKKIEFDYEMNQKELYHEVQKFSPLRTSLY